MYINIPIQFYLMNKQLLKLCPYIENIQTKQVAHMLILFDPQGIN